MITFNELLKEFESLHESIGMLPDVKLLHDYVVNNKLTEILELGILHGNSSRTFAVAASEIGGHVMSVDIEKACIDDVSQRLKKDGTENFVTFVESDSIKFLLKTPDLTYDCIFIDTNHLYRQSIAEISVAMQKIEKDGYLFLHDTNQEGVAQAITIFMKYVSDKISFTNHQTNAGLGVMRWK